MGTFISDPGSTLPASTIGTKEDKRSIPIGGEAKHYTRAADINEHTARIDAAHSALLDTRTGLLGVMRPPPGATGDVVIYVRPAGSDVTGNGSLALPYATYQRALLDLPTHTGRRRYWFDVTGIDETLPTPFVHPWTTSPAAQRSLDGTEPAGFAQVSTFKDAINVFAVPTVVHAAVPVAARTDLGGLDSGRSTLLRIAAANVTWAADGLLGLFVRDAGGAGLPFPVGLDQIEVGTGDALVDVSGYFAPVGAVEFIRCGARLTNNKSAISTSVTNEEAALLRIDSPGRWQFAGINVENDYVGPEGLQHGIAANLHGASLVAFSVCNIAPKVPAGLTPAEVWYAENQFAFVQAARSSVWFRNCHFHGMQCAAHVRIWDCTWHGWRIELQTIHNLAEDRGAPSDGALFDILGLLRHPHPVYGGGNVVIMAANDGSLFSGGFARLRRVVIVGTGLPLGLSMPNATFLVENSDLGVPMVSMGIGSRLVLQGCIASGMIATDDMMGGGNYNPGSSVGLIACMFGGIATLPDGTIANLAIYADQGQTRYDGAQFYVKTA